MLDLKTELHHFFDSMRVPAHFVETADEIAQLQDELPPGLSPFAVVEQPGWRDVYATVPNGLATAVVVWADHAIVARWESFDGFLSWSRSQRAK
jgi:hypothetical protein